MAEWLIERGIGETRAALVEDGQIVEGRIDRHDVLARHGAVLPAKLRTKAGRAGRAEAELADGTLVLVANPPVTEGATLLVEIVREAIPERGNPKLPLARPADAPARSAPGVEGTLLGAHGPDLLEQAGWSELLDQAETGLVPFPGGLLRIELTSAMTVIDVDGDLPPGELARRGAAAAGSAIRRLGLAGSIGIDLPTLPDKAARQAAAEALEATLPLPFERTAVNGFGFLQVVRKRVRPSLPELIQSDPVTAQALALLRRLEREPLPGPDQAGAPAPVARLIAERFDWIEELRRRRGRPIEIVPAL
ncbi:ribonuclease [Sphingomonas sp. ID1715]|uniref:ribonuclease n=1 Tax=Sphingomonas sp. ID1715 TaxID=1656898 RepID=UPI001487C2F8|nr:ribonuclease [Sphingomonas sp. ID1715]NNM77221.1 ribonuclease [Sphingomonas sp. ID1715]